MPLEIVRNDITRMEVDAIVNAANRSLLGGGGVDGAIHRAAGPGLLKECRTLGGCETGQAKLTGGYGLPCRYVIHTVGPVWQGGARGEREALASCYRNSLALALEKGCESVAFPMISTGVYGYPKAQALKVATEEIARFLSEHEMTVYLVVFSGDAFEPDGRLYEEVVEYIDRVYASRPEFMAEAALGAEAWDDEPAPMPRGGLFRRPHRRDDARNETVYGEAMPMAQSMPMEGLEDALKAVDESFSESLLRRIDASGMTDAECYRRANVDRRLFNKIKNNPGYRPSKQTALAFAIALRLSLEETRDMLLKAGYALSHSSKADIVVEYCIKTGNYNLFEINEVLFKLDLQPLGY